jgi:3-oxoacyl-(acyl-carrier-protein) synthase
VTAVLIRSGWWESPEMERRDDATAAWVAGILAERFGDSTISGLYLATSDSGASESIDFWRSALETGLAFAGPGAFPWTLANSPTGRIAARLGIRGPTYTLVGGADALAAAAGHALDDVACGVGPALLVALDGTDRGTVVVGAV